MTTPLVNFEPLNDCVEQTEAQLKSGRLVWVQGQNGSGRNVFASRFAASHAKTASVALLQDSCHDVSIDALYRLAAQLDNNTKRRSLLQDWPDLSLAAKELADTLVEEDRTVILRIPHTWTTTGRDKFEHTSQVWVREQRHRLREFIKPLITHSELRLVLITGVSANRDRLGLPLHISPIVLPRPVTNQEALTDKVRWGSYTAHAAQLAEHIETLGSPLPSLVRFAIGLLRLGHALGTVLQTLQKPPATSAESMARMLLATSQNPEHEWLQLVVKRLLVARRSLGKEDALRLTGVPKEHTPMVTECLAYGDGELRMGSLSREHLNVLVDQDDSESHKVFAEHYQDLDGVLNIRDAEQQAIGPWLEKTHHLSQCLDDPWANDEWHKLTLPSRTFYWNRGRTLSRVHKRFREAADVFDQCKSRWPDDAYAWHYYAYNLERALGDRGEVNQGYQRAISLDKDHPWWRSRYICFLIDQGRTEEAQTAWKAAARHFDPDGENAGSGIEQQLHYHVANKWLAEGYAEEASAVLESIPARLREQTDRMKRLQHWITDALEVEELGESLYPPSTPIERRWRTPQVLRDTLRGLPLSAWYPGRVTYVDDTQVNIAFADPLEADHERHVHDLRLSAEQWTQTSNLDLEEASDLYLEIGVYGEGEQALRVVRRVQPAQLGSLDYPPKQHLGYLAKWISLPNDG